MEVKINPQSLEVFDNQLFIKLKAYSLREQPTFDLDELESLLNGYFEDETDFKIDIEFSKGDE